MATGETDILLLRDYVTLFKQIQIDLEQTTNPPFEHHSNEMKDPELFVNINYGKKSVLEDLEEERHGSQLTIVDGKAIVVGFGDIPSLEERKVAGEDPSLYSVSFPRS